MICNLLLCMFSVLDDDFNSSQLDVLLLYLEIFNVLKVFSGQ